MFERIVQITKPKKPIRHSSNFISYTFVCFTERAHLVCSIFIWIQVSFTSNTKCCLLSYLCFRCLTHISFLSNKNGRYIVENKCLGSTCVLRGKFGIQEEAKNTENSHSNLFLFFKIHSVKRKKLIMIFT